MDAKTSWETFFKMMIMEKYEMVQDLADAPELKKLFARFAAEEQIHAQLLESELMKLEQKGI
jgi:rubrerythrin